MDANRERVDVCSLCLREASDVTHHHLIPKTTHKTKKFKKQHTVEAMRTTAPLCQPCHRACHQFFTEKELAASYYTIELLLEDEKVSGHVTWVKKQKSTLRMKKSSQGKGKINIMEDYAELTKSLVKELTHDLIAKKQFIREMEVTWNSEQIINGGGPSVVTKLVPQVKIKFWES